MKSTLFAKFLSGQINSEEKHSLEKMSLDDALLGDALEGYETIQKSNIPERLEAIGSRIKSYQPRGKSSMVISLWPYAVAASVAVLVIYFGLFKSSNVSVDENRTALFTEHKDDAISEQIKNDKAVEEALSEHVELLQDLSAVDNQEITESGPPASIKKRSVAVQEKKTSSHQSDIAAVKSPPAQDQMILTDENPSFSEEASDVNAIAENTLTETEKSNLPLSFNRSIQDSRIANLLAPSAITYPIDTLGGYPVTGFEKVRIMNAEWSKTLRQELFMRGIQIGNSTVVQFNVSASGIPQNVQVAGIKDAFVKERIVDFIMSTGNWVAIDANNKISLVVLF